MPPKRRRSAETEEEAGVDGDLLGPVGALEFDWGSKRYRVEVLS